MSYSMDPFRSPITSLDVQYSGKTKGMCLGDNSVAVSYNSQNNNDRTVCYWDLRHHTAPNQVEYKIKHDPNMKMKMGTNQCFFINIREDILGCINSDTKHLQKTPHGIEDFSVENSNGITIGKVGKKTSLIFWDLITMQQTSSVDLAWHARNLCAIVPSQNTNLAITLQTDLLKESVITLWDARDLKEPIKMSSLKPEIHSMAVIETSEGLHMVTRSIDDSAIDFRRILDGSFGEVTNRYYVPQGSGPYSGYDLSLSAQSSKLNTSTKNRKYTGRKGYSDIATQVTVRSYDFYHMPEEKITPKPNLAIEFRTSTTEDFENSIAFDKENVAILGSNKVLIY